MILIELNHAEGSGILYGVAEHYGPAMVFHFLLCPREYASKVLSMEHIVTQYQRARLTGQKVMPDGKCFGKSRGSACSAYSNRMPSSASSPKSPLKAAGHAASK